MGKHSDSSGSGNLLVRGFMGIVSITATAIVSTVVQRYLSPSQAPASWGPASPPTEQPSITATPPSVELQPTGAESAVPSSASGVETNQIEVYPPGTNSQETSQPDRAAEAGQWNNSPIQVETQPVPDAAYSPTETAGNTAGAADPSTTDPSSDVILREKLDNTLREKWQKH